MDIEHLINSIKAYAAARGVHHTTWDQLALFAPLVPVLRPLKFQFSKFFGASWRGTTHTKPDTSRRVRDLMGYVQHDQLHIPQPGRKAKQCTVDVIAKGATHLKKKGVKQWRNAYLDDLDDQEGEGYELSQPEYMQPGPEDEEDDDSLDLDTPLESQTDTSFPAFVNVLSASD